MINLYEIENAFSILYEESEKYNLDLLGFASFEGNIDMNSYKFYLKNYHNYFETPIIYQPQLTEKQIIKDERGEIINLRDTIYNYLYKTELLFNVTKEIDDKFKLGMKTSFEDIFLFFITVKRAKNLKHIKKLFYVTLQGKKSKNSLIKYFIKKNIKLEKKIYV